MVRFAVANNASDIHLASNNVPAYRVNGVVNYYEGMPVLDDDTVIGYMHRCCHLMVCLTFWQQVTMTVHIT